MIDLRQGDCLEVMRTLPDNSVHACVTDPPYGLAFMGKKWDYDVPSEDVWREVLRILKPGGFLLSFSGTRTYHRMAVRIEDAGFEIRDMIQWLYGSGFPKSHDISKAIDKEAGAERDDAIKGGHMGISIGGGDPRCERAHEIHKLGNQIDKGRMMRGTPATDAAKQWEGFGTALKPANEPVCVARRPLIGTVAQNVLAHGCGGLNIDGCRVRSGDEASACYRKPTIANIDTESGRFQKNTSAIIGTQDDAYLLGRWPANVVHDGSDEACAGMGESSRYFYSAKADRAEREKGVDSIGVMRNDGRQTEIDNPYQRGKVLRNHHPTVKPVDLMRWLVRLVCPPGGVVLDPYTGSGTTGVACRLEGFGFIGIELNPEYIELARQRIAAETPSLFTEAI
jgi:site-specific DNA-methyltransferase (adenine-specific)